MARRRSMSALKSSHARSKVARSSSAASRHSRDGCPGVPASGGSHSTIPCTRGRDPGRLAEQYPRGKAALSGPVDTAQIGMDRDVDRSAKKRTEKPEEHVTHRARLERRERGVAVLARRSPRRCDTSSGPPVIATIRQR
jgi:hypothetical protein